MPFGVLPRDEGASRTGILREELVTNRKGFSLIKPFLCLAGWGGGVKRLSSVMRFSAFMFFPIFAVETVALPINFFSARA